MQPKRQDHRQLPAIWKTIGLPAYTGTAAGKTAVCHDRYVTSNDNASKTPDWVVELLTKAKLTNKYSRPPVDFSPDPCVPDDGSPDPGDYEKTADKFAKGHMAPSEDFNNNIVNMRRRTRRTPSCCRTATIRAGKAATISNSGASMSA